MLNQAYFIKGLSLCLGVCGALIAAWFTLVDVEESNQSGHAPKRELSTAKYPQKPPSSRGLTGLPKVQGVQNSASQFELTDVPALNREQLSQALRSEFSDHLILTMFGLQGDGSYQTINKIVDQLCQRASKQDIKAMSRYLESPHLAHMNADEWRAIQKHIVDFFALYWQDRDGAEELLWRHLANEKSNVTAKISILNRLDRMYRSRLLPDELEQFLWQQVDNQQGDLIASSMRTLARLEYHKGEVDRERLSTAAISLLRREDLSVMVRVTALQTATWLQNPHIHQEAIDLVENPSTPEVLKLTAIGTLQKLGDAASMSALDQVDRNQSEALFLAAQEAMKSLSKK